MSQGVDLEIELRPLLEEQDTKVSARPPQCAVEVVRDRSNPSLGYITLEVRGFVADDARRLRRSFSGALNAYTAVLATEERKVSELNPGADPNGEDFARILAASEIADWKERASLCLLKATRDICFLGVVGYEPGQLRLYGQPLPYATEEREVLGSKRTGLSMQALLWLEKGGFGFALATQILRVSEGKPALTKEEQWAKPKEVAQKSANPFEEAPAPSPVN